MDIASLGLELRSDGLTKGTNKLRELEGQSKRTEGAAAQLGRTLRNMAGGFLAATAAAASLGSAIASARQFNAAIAEVSTLLPVVEGELERITEASRRMAREFGGTATAQAQAFYQAISAGAGDAVAATELLEVANRVAIGGVTQVTVAVDVLTTAQNAYAASGLTAADAADTLFVGMRAGKTTIGELSGMLGRVIPQATAVGFAFDEIVAATAALTTQGQSTEMAVTGLSGIMTQLLKPSSQAIELANQLGIEFTATKAATMGLSDFMGYLVEKTGGSQEALATLFGSTEALRAVFSLAGQGGVKFTEILDQMQNRSGAADEAFRRVADSLDHRLNVATAKFADMALTVGNVALAIMVPAMEAVLSVVDALMPAIAGVVEIGGRLFDWVKRTATEVAGPLLTSLDKATGASDWLADKLGIAGSAFSDLRGYIIAAALAATAYYTPAMIGLATSVMGAVFSLGVLRGALIATGIGAAVVAAGYLINKFLELSEAAGGFGKAFGLVKDLGVEAMGRLRLAGGAVVEGYKAYTAGFVLLWREAFATVMNLFAKFSDDILSGMQAVFRSLGLPGQAMVTAIDLARTSIKGMIADSAAAANANADAQRAVMEGHMQAAAQMAKDALAPLEAWQAINETITAAKAGAAGMPSAPAVAGSPGVDLTGSGTGGGAANDNSAADSALKASQQFIDSLQDEIDKLTLTEAAYRQLQVTKARAMAPTQEMADLILMLGQQRDLTLEQVKAEELLKTAQTSLEDLQFELELLGMNNVERARAITLRDLERQGIVQGTEAWNQYGQAILDAAGALATANDNTRSTMEEAARGLSMLSRGFGDLASVMKDSVGEQSAVYKALFAAQHAFALAASLVSIQQAMAQALALPPPANFMYMGIVAAEGASIIASIQALATGFANGGYTGAGGKYDVAGVVHKGEVVWSQQDVARYGGWQNVDAMRRGIMPAANDNGGSGRIELDINVTVDDDGRIAAYVSRGMNEAVNASVRISDQRAQARTDAMQAEQRRPVISARGAA